MPRPKLLEFKIPKTTNRPDVTRKKRTRISTGYCQHQKVWLDEDTELVECETCGQFFTAYRYLKMICIDWGLLDKPAYDPRLEVPSDVWGATLEGKP